MTKQYHLPLPFEEAMGLEDFLISPANQDAVRLLLDREPAAWGAHALLLWGGAGTGKTHLLSLWRQRFGAQEIAPGDEDVLAELASGQCKTASFVIDGLDAIAGQRDKEEWMQHFYNATKEAQIPLLLSARQPVALWGLTLKDIETRLKTLPAIQLQEPDDDLMRGLLIKLFADRQLRIEAGVVEYLAARLERTGTALREAVQTLDEAALENKRKISIPFAQKILKF